MDEESCYTKHNNPPKLAIDSDGFLRVGNEAVKSPFKITDGAIVWKQRDKLRGDRLIVVPVAALNNLIK